MKIKSLDFGYQSSFIVKQDDCDRIQIIQCMKLEKLVVKNTFETLKAKVWKFFVIIAFNLENKSQTRSWV